MLDVEKQSARMEMDKCTCSLLLLHDGLWYEWTFLIEKEDHHICRTSVEMASFSLTGQDFGQRKIEGQVLCLGRTFLTSFGRISSVLISSVTSFPPPHEKVAESHTSRKLSMVPEKSLFLILICNRPISPVDEISVNYFLSHFYYLTISHHN